MGYWTRLVDYLGRSIRRQINDGPAGISRRVKEFMLLVIKVLTRVRRFVFEHFDEFVETRGEEGSKDRSEPIDL